MIRFPRWIWVVAIFATGAMQATRAYAQPRLDLANMTAEQIDASDVMEVYAAADQMGEASRAPPGYPSYAIRRALATLYYPVDLSALSDPRTDERLSEQVAAFQRTLGVSPDGTLTMGEFKRLLGLEGMANVTPLTLPPAMPPQVTNDWASGSGTWIIQHDQIAYPLNSAEIRCYRADQYCEMNEIDFSGPSGQNLSTDLDWYQPSMFSTTYVITSWADGIVEARSQPGPNECRTTTLILNSATATISQVTQDLARQCTLPDGRAFPRLGAPRVATLERPGAIVRNYFARIWDEVERHHGPLAPTAYHRPYLPTLD